MPKTAEVEIEDLVSYFHLPISDVARHLCLSPATLKKVCRQYGVSRWPYRKIKALQKMIETLQSICPKTEQERTSLSKDISDLQRQKLLLLSAPLRVKQEQVDSGVINDDVFSGQCSSSDDSKEEKKKSKGDTLQEENEKKQKRKSEEEKLIKSSDDRANDKQKRARTKIEQPVDDQRTLLKMDKSLVKPEGNMTSTDLYPINYSLNSTSFLPHRQSETPKFSLPSVRHLLHYFPSQSSEQEDNNLFHSSRLPPIKMTGVDFHHSSFDDRRPFTEPSDERLQFAALPTSIACSSSDLNQIHISHKRPSFTYHPCLTQSVQHQIPN
eukprot:TRINITY_DN2071_c0_g1_i1.p1 TRINITY_DN2071_c0_g1~~TRINITY_DN2071_c0_g1_i1.p1  ORF type:complete len:325 (-),score=58.71 TRINITY_DN2071_c0_g1_i1:231-1205(-)